MLRRALTCLLVLGASLVLAAPLQFYSTTEESTIIELYTSEGCSSCPPADVWLSQLKDDARLFSSLFPMAFHVDYWDGLGWRDRFGSREFSERQREYVRRHRSRQVYTPGFMVNAQEWRGWFGRQSLPVGIGRTGELALQWAPDRTLNYQFASPHAARERQLHIAYLGMGLCSAVASGENSDRRLCHDFVVLEHLQFALESPDRLHYRGVLSLPPVPQRGQSGNGLVVWISHGDSLEMEQIAGGYLPPSSPVDAAGAR